MPVSDGPAAPAGIRIRPIRASESQCLQALITSEQADSAAGPSPRGAGLEAELSNRAGRWVEAWIAHESPRSGIEFLGLGTLVTSEGRFGLRRSIAWLLVHPSARRQGIGRAIVETICHDVSTRDQVEIWVECHTRWHAAMAFWASVGFATRT